MTEITKEQREYLTHMLGMGKHTAKSLRGYRNRFCAGVGGKDEAALTVMADAGLVERGRTINDGASVYFYATEAGMDAIGMSKAEKRRAMED